MSNYSESDVTLWFVLKEIAKSCAVIALSSYLFFDSFFGVIPLLPYGVYSIYKISRKAGERQRQILITQFKDVLGALRSALEAGISFEQAIPVAREDIVVLYGPKSFMAKELSKMEAGLRLGKNVEEVVLDFAGETKVAEIENFADLFCAAKRTGGNIIKLTRAASRDLYEKVELKREIEGVIQSMVTESNVMKLMPLVILTYMRLCAGEFMKVLFVTALGKVTMCIIAVLYFVMVEYAERLVASAGGVA